MRVGVDATCWSNRRGYGRFTRGLLSALLESNTRHEFIFFVDAHTFSRARMPAGATYVVVPTTQSPTEAASAEGRRSLRDLLAMTRAVARYPLDAFFFPSVYTYFPVWTRATVILGIHDVIAEDYPDLVFPDRRGRRLWNLKSAIARRQADYILTVSEHAKSGIVRHFGHQPERVWVVDEAPDPIFRRLLPDEIDSALLSRYGLARGDRFLLYLGGINPHKNLLMLIESLAAVRRQPGDEDVRLVIIGDIKGDVFTPGLEALQTRIRELGLGDAVCFAGYLADAEALHFFNAAQALMLPSFAEGFGLPAVEGAACGTPVIATANSPLPQLLAGGGIFVDPTRPKQLTHALEALLGDEGSRRRMAEVAYEKAGGLTWPHAAEQMQAMLAAVEQKRR